MIFREEDVGGRERVTTDEDQVPRGGLNSNQAMQYACK